jgi:hypothetical protein
MTKDGLMAMCDISPNSQFSLMQAEQLLFERYCSGALPDVPVMNTSTPVVFIIGSPRTGSTYLYQLLINWYRFFYFTNFINSYFYTEPAVGAAIDFMTHPLGGVSYDSCFGKTLGMFGPSEGSYILKNWFGGTHPSQSESCDVLDGKTAHFRRSMQCIYEIHRKPILIKNAWNCFRIKALSELFPNARFIWIRRDIVESSFSALNARVATGDIERWNSATPTNFKSIQSLQPWAQVVEQQYEFNKAISEDLDKYRAKRHRVVWYEDLCIDPCRIMDEFQGKIIAERHIPKLGGQWGKTETRQALSGMLGPFYRNQIRKYVQHAKGDRLEKYRYRK